MRAANSDPGFWRFLHAMGGSRKGATQLKRWIDQGRRGKAVARGFSIGGRYFSIAAPADDGCGWAWNGLRNCGENVLDGARFAANIDLTTAGWLWAEAHGANCGFDDGKMIVCRGQDGGYARGGTTIGNVYMTGDQDVDEAKLRHESFHTTQTAVLSGPFMGMAYDLDWIIAGRDPCRQVMERMAGLEDGGYNEC